MKNRENVRRKEGKNVKRNVRKERRRKKKKK